MFLCNLINTADCDLDDVSRPSGMAKYVFKNMKKELNAALIEEDSDYGIEYRITKAGYKVTDKNLRFYYWGMMLHIITDMYAHRTYKKLSDGSYEMITEDDKDDTAVVSNRWKSAKKVVKNILSNRLNTSNPYKSETFKCADFNLGNSYYSGFKIQNFKKYMNECGLTAGLKTSETSYLDDITKNSSYMTVSEVQAAYEG